MKKQKYYYACVLLLKLVPIDILVPSLIVSDGAWKSFKTKIKKFVIYGTYDTF